MARVVSNEDKRKLGKALVGLSSLLAARYAFREINMAETDVLMLSIEQAIVAAELYVRQLREDMGL